MYEYEVWEFDSDLEEYTRKVWETDYFFEALDYAYDFSRRNEFEYIVLECGVSDRRSLGEVCKANKQPIRRLYNGKEL